MLYNNLSSYLKAKYGKRLSKICIDGGFSCPNRDGACGHGGCIFCGERGAGEHIDPAKSIRRQVEDALARSKGDEGYIAYFQNFTNTYAPVSVLKERYDCALIDSRIKILAIGTRPDCMSEELLDYLALLQKRTFVLVEYGIESVNDATLVRINRGHDYACAVDTIERTAGRGIPVGGHIILGLPGEGREELVAQATEISRLPLTTLKLHQLQLIKGTRMAAEYVESPGDFSLFAMEDYIETVVDYVEHLRPDIVLERFASQSPKELLIAPDWGVKNFELVDKIKSRMRERDTWQGRLYRKE